MKVTNESTSTNDLGVTSVRHPAVQAQYAHDVAAEKAVFGAVRPCAMGKMILRESAPDADPHDPVLGENLYPYVHFADQEVLRHQLLTPRAHVPDLTRLLDSDPEAWRRFHLRVDLLRKEGRAVFIHGLGSAAMSVAAHLHAHVFTLGEKIEHFDYDPEAGRVRIRAGGRWLVDTVNENSVPAPTPWEPEPSACDRLFEERFG